MDSSVVCFCPSFNENNHFPQREEMGAQIDAAINRQMGVLLGHKSRCQRRRPLAGAYVWPHRDSAGTREHGCRFMRLDVS